MELLKGQELLRADETKVNADEVLKDKDYVLFYFAAHWWPPCRKFTYKLKKFYKEVKDKNVEIIYIHGDQSEKSMFDNMSDFIGDWLAVEYKSDLSQQLIDKFKVGTIPTLAVMKGDGTVICYEDFPELAEFLKKNGY